MRTAHAAVLATTCLLLAGCGSDASDVVSETAAKLGEVRSGTLSMRVVLGGAEEAGGGDVGFELSGPFSLPEAGQLPIADIEYTQLAGPERGEASFISTGDAAFVELEGTTYELPEEQLEGLRAPEEETSGVEVFGDLEVDQWIVDPELNEGGEVGGAETDRVSGELDVVTALNDLLDVAAQFGASGFGGLSQVEGDSAEQLENAVESATIEIYSGTEDRLLRRVDIEIEFGASGSGEVSDEVAGVLGTRLTLEMTISDPNEPIDVEEPTDAVPYPGP